MKKYFLTGILLFVTSVLNAQGKFFGGNSDGYASASLPFVVLPVTRIELFPVQCNNDICLEWTTLQERNTNHFEIERSSDASRFGYVGQVKATGNSSSVRRYSFTDKNPFTGNNYYRLKQVDINGRTTYSETMFVKYTANRLIRQILIPTRYELAIHLNNNGDPVVLKIFDVNGKMIFSNKYVTNIIIIPNTHSFASGLYIVLVEGNGQVDREKFILK